jgi:U3 small nucleolar RNA-associated protein 10
VQLNPLPQTIDSIVPVVISNFKRSHAGGLSLYIASRDFLCTFTDAAHHIPRHRRSKFVIMSLKRCAHLNCVRSFFIHLVDVLGPDDFLAPVCMLLVEKVANRVVRQNDLELQNTLSLPSAVMQHYAINLHIQVSHSVASASVPAVSHIAYRRSLNHCTKVGDSLSARCTQKTRSQVSWNTRGECARRITFS